jgi:hypothetical protein
MHFPENFQFLNKAKYRIFFERLLHIQIISIFNKKEYQEELLNINS